MIRSLYLKNFALVDELKIEFTNGLNIITGETGAGKSILVNALGQLCGERSSSDYIRSGEKKAVIEAEFSGSRLPEIQNRLQKLDIENPNQTQIIIRKEISSNGSSRVFINDSPVTLQKIGLISALLVDLHGQHQHQRLLNPDFHISYLDSYGDFSEDILRFGALLNQYKSEIQELSNLQKRQLNAFQKHDLFKYQNDELTKASLESGELEELRSELKILANVENLHQFGGALEQILYSGDVNVGTLLTSAVQNLRELEKLDEKFNGFSENLAVARETVEEIGRFTEQYLSDLEFNPQRMEFIHQRISQLEFLLKKYQQENIDNLISLHNQMQADMQENEQFDERIEDQKQKINNLILSINEQGLKISNKRKALAEKLEDAINPLLAQVGMPNARFKVLLTLNEKKDSPFTCGDKNVVAENTGFDNILFEIASNAGEDFKPIHKIASGGEISRLMLSLKTALAESDKIPSLVFDEIDAGISGKVAQIVGAKLADLSKYHQIICVTHLPQIAAFAESHFKVEKYIEDKRTYVDTKMLGLQQREEEVAALLGGSAVSAQALENARQLIREAKSA